MNLSEHNIRIQNIIGKFAQYVSAQAFQQIPDEIFSRSEDTVYTAPDSGVHCQGFAAVRDYFSSLPRQPERELLFTHTHILRFSEDGASAQGTWMAHCFLNRQEAGGEAEVDYGCKRIDAEFVLEDGRWKCREMHIYYFISLIPEQYDPAVYAADHTDCWENVLPPAYSGATTAWDYIAIRQVQNRWAQDKRSGWMDLFAERDDISMNYPLFFKAPKCGRAAVAQAIDELDRLEQENDRKYIDTVMTASAVIEVSEDGRTAVGVWHVIGNSIQGPAFGHQEPYCPNLCRLGRLKQTFVKEGGAWKILRFDLEYLLTLPKNTFDRENSRGTPISLPGDNWLRPPKATGHTLEHIEDVLELEQLVGYWTYGLRNRSFAPFYYTYYAREREDLIDPEFAPSSRMFGTTDSFSAEQPKYVGLHCGTTPLVEVDETGTFAEVEWLDYGYTSYGEKFGFTENPFYANCSIGRYYFKCVKCGDRWKMYRWEWRPFYRIRYLADFWRFDYRTTKGWAGSDTTKRFPLPFEPFEYVSARRDWTKPFKLDPPGISTPFEQQVGIRIGD